MSTLGRFRDRAEAGRLLGERLGEYAGRGDVVVLGLPRGGVPVAREVARALGAPLDVFLVRKLGLPGQPELAMGAIASGGTRVLNEELVRELRLDDALIERVAEREEAELVRREQAYRGERPPPDLRGRTVVLVDDGLATLLVDRLTPGEEEVDLRTREHRFDIELLAGRLLAAAAWAARDERTRELSLGLFGASTGAGAALVAAAREPAAVRAVVSRGGRPDLAGPALAEVRAPTLLVVGGRDGVVLDLNRSAAEAMTGAAAVELEVVRGATHLFEEPGALERVAELARGWFTRFLGERREDA